jgi:hypothetical protein
MILINEIEIESLLFKQVEKPKNYLMTRIINVYDNRFRINIYVQIEEDNLTKKRIDKSYFCQYSPGKLTIFFDKDTEKLNDKRKNSNKN